MPMPSEYWVFDELLIVMTRAPEVVNRAVSYTHLTLPTIYSV